MEPNVKRLCGMLGFAMRAGKLVIGTELVCRAMAASGEKKPKLIAVASDVSAGTCKKIFTKSEYYGIEAVTLPFPMEELGRIVGKAGAAACAAVSDARFADEIRKALHPEIM